MSRREHPVKQMVLEGIAGGYAVSGEQIQQLRARSEKAISFLKKVFWVAIGLFNLMVWYPFPGPISDTLRWTVGLGALLVAIFYPIIGIRRHRGYLNQLEDCARAPKRRKADDSGRQYMDLVKKQGRFFVLAECSVLEGEIPPE